MPIEVKWFVEGKVIQAVGVGDISLDDITYSSNAIIDLINSSDSPLVHLVLSEENMESLPLSLRAFSEAAKFLHHERLGWFLIYGNMDRAKHIKFLDTMVIQIAQVRHRRFTTWAECLEFLLFVDSALPNIEDMLTD